MKIVCSGAREWPSDFKNRKDAAYSEKSKELLRRLRLSRLELRYIQPKSQDLDILFKIQNWN